MFCIYLFFRVDTKFNAYSCISNPPPYNYICELQEDYQPPTDLVQTFKVGRLALARDEERERDKHIYI